MQIESGEYFMNEQLRKDKTKTEKQEKAKEKSVEKKQKRDEEFIAPSEEIYLIYYDRKGTP
jgi:ribosomal RNA assembly protein